MTDSVVHKFPRFTEVSAPLIEGSPRLFPATVDAFLVSMQGTDDIPLVLLRLDKKNFTDEEWAEFCPSNHPVAFKSIREDLLIGEPVETVLMTPPCPPDLIPKPVKPPSAAVVAKTSSSDAPAVHQVWQSKRSPSKYEIISINGSEIKLKEVGITYTRVVTWEALQKGYTFDGTTL